MAGFVAEFVIALFGGAVGAAALLAVRSNGRHETGEARSSAPALPGALPPGPLAQDRWLPAMHRCEQAVFRAARAAESVSSSTARLDLHSIVRRMDAELPSVRMLVELGRSLEADGHNEDAGTARVQRQLDDAALGFVAVSDQLVQTVMDLVAAPDFGRVHEQVQVMRDRFPLQQPMSALLTSPEGKFARPSARALDRPSV